MKERAYIGVLGYVYPFVLMVFGIISGIPQLGSISEYYHTPVQPVFVCVNSMLAILLFTYEGYDSVDDLVTRISGIALMGLTFFPTTDRMHLWCSEYQNQSVHIISALIFFISIIFIVMCQFTKTGPGGRSVMTEKKKVRNSVYRWCGWVMIISLLAILIRFCTGMFGSSLVFFAEWTSLGAFGMAWTVKGGILLKD